VKWWSKVSYASKYSVCVILSWLIWLNYCIWIIESQSAFSIFIILTDGKIDDIGATNEEVCDFYYYYRWPRGARNPNLNVTITNACAAVILFGPSSIFASFGWTSTPNRCFLFTVYVVFQPLCSPQCKSTVSQLQASLETHSYQGEISTVFYFTSQNSSLHQEPNMYNTRILIIILNAQLSTTAIFLLTHKH